MKNLKEFLYVGNGKELSYIAPTLDEAIDKAKETKPHLFDEREPWQIFQFREMRGPELVRQSKSFSLYDAFFKYAKHLPPIMQQRIQTNMRRHYFPKNQTIKVRNEGDRDFPDSIEDAIANHAIFHFTHEGSDYWSGIINLIVEAKKANPEISDFSIGRMLASQRKVRVSLT